MHAVLRIGRQTQVLDALLLHADGVCFLQFRDFLSFAHLEVVGFLDLLDGELAVFLLLEFLEAEAVDV